MLAILFGSSTSLQLNSVFLSHRYSSSHQPVKSVFLSHHSSTSHQLQPSEQSEWSQIHSGFTVDFLLHHHVITMRLSFTHVSSSFYLNLEGML